MTITIIIIAVAVLMALLLMFLHHQRLLRKRAYLMEEAMNNRDFTFRLPTDGLFSGERAMQESLNKLGEIIRQQVSLNEVESWERLTRVLTHEIMNSTAPIASISQSMMNREDVKGTPLEDGVIAIHNTAQHLNTFVDSFRKLSQLQKPAPEAVDLDLLLNDLKQMFSTVTWEISIDRGLKIYADKNLIRQVMINLAKNAVEAKAKRIGVSAETHDNRCIIYFSNDGSPIPANLRKSIFVPFFTTKKSGTGVGLSMSKKVMIKQGGDLELADAPQSSFITTFILQLPSLH